MTLPDLVPIIFERFSAFQTIWNLYIAMVLGVIGFIASAQQAMRSRIIRIVLTVSFLAFATVNSRALDSLHTQRTMLIDLASTLAKENNETAMHAILEKGRPDKKWKMLTFHLAADGAIVFLIWFVPAYRLKHERNS